MEAKGAPVKPTFWEAFRFWLKLGFISFGGPAGQLAIMHAELVAKKRWISEVRFLHALNFCMLLPGPEAQQVATYIGWLLHRTWGGVVAGVLFVLPSALILWGLSILYVRYGDLPAVAAIFYGLQPAVVAIVAAAVVRLGDKALKSRINWGIAVMAFVALSFLEVHFAAVIVTAGVVGFLGGKYFPGSLAVPKEPNAGAGSASVLDDDDEAQPRPTWRRVVGVALVCLVLWWLPVFAAGLWFGWDGILFHQGLFFSKAALVTFGGAYAVLPYVAQQAVENFGWLSTNQMMSGLGLAETTPGPLVMVLQFVGFVGGWQHPGSMNPLLAATLGAAITTWVTFLPCFLFIFTGAPYIEQVRNVRTLTYALSAITAAVVGVVFNLAVWFGWHVLFPGRVDWFALVMAAALFVAILRFKCGVIPVVFAAGLLGLAFKLVID